MINADQFRSALAEARGLSLEQLRAEAGAGTSRSYFVRSDDRSIPLKAVTRLAYRRAGMDWDGPQSSAVARLFRDEFAIEHVTQTTERSRLERQHETIERWARPDQVKFRRELLELYGHACAITGCSTLDAIDAAHIVGVDGQGVDEPHNGIIMRADLHRLFDRNLMAIDPVNLTVHFAPGCRDHYIDLEQRRLVLPAGGPAGKHFKPRWRLFQRMR